MEKDMIIQQLYEYALEYKLTDFHQLYHEKVLQDGDNMAEAHLLCAQLKIMTADESFQDELSKAEGAKIQLKHPCLYLKWQPKDPNGLIIYRKKEGNLQCFLDALDKREKRLERWYGNAGLDMCRQIKSEILYFMGRVREAAEIAEDLFEGTKGNCAKYITAGYALIRCYLALDEIDMAQETMLGIIRAVNTSAESDTGRIAYRAIRRWVNITTGWGGDMPRYHHTPDNVVLPVLEDRISEIINGIDQLGPTEQPFADFSQLEYDDSKTVRDLYMDIFRCVHAFRMRELSYSDPKFEEAYSASRPNNLIMPFVEYGKQIVPLLNYIIESKNKYDREWIENIIVLAERYEESINSYRQA